MKSLTKAAFNYGFASRQRIAPKQFNHSNKTAIDDFKKNAANGLILRKQGVK